MYTILNPTFKKRFGAIIATLYVPAGIQISLLVNLTLFHWAGWGEGQSAQNKNSLFFLYIFLCQC